MNKVKNEVEEISELIDCGQASKVTKGIPLFFLFELAFPPFDRLFLL